MTETKTTTRTTEPMFIETSTWGGMQFPKDRWEDGISDQLSIEEELKAWRTIPPIHIGNKQFALTDYPLEFLNWLEANSPLEGAEEFVAYLSGQGASPWFVAGHTMALTPDGQLVVG